MHKKWYAMIGVGTGVLMATLDASIVNISLPILVEQLNTNFATISWVVLAYGLVVTALMLGVARLGDMFDKKRIYMAGLFLFTVASLLCGLAPSVYWLIAFRALQGLGAAMTQALGMAIVTEAFPAAERGKALGTIGAVVSTGIAIGPPLGGLLIGLVGWRSIFLINVPIGILAVWIVHRFAPSSSTRPNQRFDGAGALILFATLVCYALGMTLAQSQGAAAAQPRLLLLAAALGFGLFLWIERRVAQPMIDLGMFRNPLFSINLAMGFLVFTVLAGGFLMPFFLQLAKGYSVQQVGLLLMVNPIVTGLLAPLAGTLSDRFGSRRMSMIGLAVIIGGCLLVSTLNESVGVAGFLLRFLPFAIGIGLFQAPNNSAIMGTALRERMGIVSGLVGLSRTLGSSTGLPMIAALFATLVITAGALPAGTDPTTAPPAALIAGINGVYRIAAVVIAVSFFLSWLALRIDARQKAAAAQQPAHD